MSKNMGGTIVINPANRFTFNPDILDRYQKSGPKDASADLSSSSKQLSTEEIRPTISESSTAQEITEQQTFVVTTESGRRYDLEKSEWIEENIEIDPKLITSFSGRGRGEGNSTFGGKRDREESGSGKQSVSSHSDDRSHHSKRSGGGRSSGSDRKRQDTDALRQSGVHGYSRSIRGTDDLFLLGQEFIRKATAKAGGNEDLLDVRMKISEELNILNLLLEHKEVAGEIKILQLQRQDLLSQASALRNQTRASQESKLDDERVDKRPRTNIYEIERKEIEGKRRQIEEKRAQIADPVNAAFGSDMATTIYHFLDDPNNKIDFDKLEKRVVELQSLKAELDRNPRLIQLQDDAKIKGIQNTNVVTANVIFNLEIDGVPEKVLMPAYRGDKRIFTASDVGSLSQGFIDSEFEKAATQIDKTIFKEEAVSQSRSSHEDFEDSDSYKNHSERALAGYLWEDAEKMSNRVRQRLSLPEGNQRIIINSISVDMYSTRSSCNHCEPFLSQNWGEIARRYAAELTKSFTSDGKSVDVEDTRHGSFARNSIVKTMIYTQDCDLGDRRNPQKSSYFDVDDKDPRFSHDPAFVQKYIKEEESGIGKDNYRWPPRTFFVSQPTGTQLHGRNSVYTATIKPSQEESAKEIVSNGIKGKWQDIVTKVMENNNRDGLPSKSK